MTTDCSSTLRAREVAAELKVSLDHFMATRAQMERAGFPRPVPMFSRLQTEAERAASLRRRGRPPLRWSADAVRAWIANPAPAGSHAPAANDDGPNGGKLAARDRDHVRKVFG